MESTVHQGCSPVPQLSASDDIMRYSGLSAPASCPDSSYHGRHTEPLRFAVRGCPLPRVRTRSPPEPRHRLAHPRAREAWANAPPKRCASWACARVAWTFGRAPGRLAVLCDAYAFRSVSWAESRSRRCVGVWSPTNCSNDAIDRLKWGCAKCSRQTERMLAGWRFVVRHADIIAAKSLLLVRTISASTA